MTTAMMSWYRSAVDPVPGGKLTLGDLAAKVRTSPKLAKQIEGLRTLLEGRNREGYDKAKRELPGMTPSGRFERRASEGLVEHSGLVVVDLDGLPDLAAAEAARDAAAGSPNVALSFVSPSGRGVKVIVSVGLLDGCAVDAKTHGAAWEAAAAQVRELTGCEVDRTGRDVARLCFMSHDPQAKYNPDAEPLRVERPAPREKPAPHPGTLTDAAAWADGALREEMARVAGSKPGERNTMLNQAAYNLGQIVAGGYLNRADVETRLLAAGELAGLPGQEAERTIRSGLEAGEREPRHPAAPDLPTANAQALAACEQRDAAERAALRRSSAQPMTRCLKDVQPELVAWLWPGRIPLSKLTLLVGHPGIGKSCVTMEVAAMVTRGAPLPAGEGRAPSGSVVILSAEDGAADTIRPRLDAAGGDPARVTLLEAVREGDRERGLALDRDIEALAALLLELGDVRLVVVDPISAYLGSCDDNANGVMRGLLAPLARLAQQHGCAVLLVSHFRKGQAGAALMRAIGTVGLIAACRAAWGMAKDPDNPGDRLLLPLKNNLAVEAPGIRFRLVEPPGHAAPAVAWGELIHGADVDRLMGSDPDREQRGERDAPALEEAQAWLADALADGPVPACELQRRAKSDGLSWATVRRAKDALGAKSSRGRFSAESGWQWYLPRSQGAHLPMPRCSDERLGKECPETPEFGASCQDAHESTLVRPDEHLGREGASAQRAGPWGEA